MLDAAAVNDGISSGVRICGVNSNGQSQWASSHNNLRQIAKCQETIANKVDAIQMSITQRPGSRVRSGYNHIALLKERQLLQGLLDVDG